MEIPLNHDHVPSSVCAPGTLGEKKIKIGLGVDVEANVGIPKGERLALEAGDSVRVAYGEFIVRWEKEHARNKAAHSKGRGGGIIAGAGGRACWHFKLQDRRKGGDSEMVGYVGETDSVSARICRCHTERELLPRADCDRHICSHCRYC
jgi:hypothetical protein